ncbi:MAG: hypothetical protein JXI43_06290 [Tissierellales bacterium]|nr:hypothetical protein [Tissierellales bacterium]
MAKIVLISCVSKKIAHPAPAKDLYDSTLFKSCYTYGVSLHPDMLFILSAKYGLVPADKMIAPYDLTLNNMKTKEIQEWSKDVLFDLKNNTDLESDTYIFLAGEKYRRYLLPHIKHYEIPMRGLKIGEQLSWLKTANLKIK